MGGVLLVGRSISGIADLGLRIADLNDRGGNWEIRKLGDGRASTNFPISQFPPHGPTSVRLTTVSAPSCRRKTAARAGLAWTRMSLTTQLSSQRSFHQEKPRRAGQRPAS